MIKLVHFITSLEMGGAQAVLYDLVTHLDPHRFEQHVFFIHSGPYEKQLRKAGIAIHQIRGAFATYDPALLYRIITLLKQVRPDCLHTILWSANLFGRIAAWWMNIRCISALHNNIDQNGALRNVLDQCIPTRNQFIAVSEEVKRSYERYHHKKQNIVVIPNGIDHKTIQNHIATHRIKREKLGYTNDHIIIGSVGRLHPIKRYPLLLESFALLYKTNTQLRLLLIGSGKEEQRLKEKALALGIANEVKFATNQKAYGYYPLLDCFVLSSEKEGISIALLEAMSCSIAPIITYHSTTHPVIIDGHNGVVAQAQNATQFAPVLKKILADQSLRHTLGKNAQKTVQSNFDIHKMIAAYDHIFREKGL